MELWNDEVRLSRRERRALCVEGRSVSALHLGSLWRASVEAADDRLRRLRNMPSEAYAVVGLGVVSVQNPVRSAIQALERDRHVLSIMEPNVLGIERDTLPLEADQQRDL